MSTPQALGPTGSSLEEQTTKLKARVQAAQAIVACGRRMDLQGEFSRAQLLVPCREVFLAAEPIARAEDIPGIIAGAKNILYEPSGSMHGIKFKHGFHDAILYLDLTNKPKGEPQVGFAGAFSVIPPEKDPDLAIADSLDATMRYLVAPIEVVNGDLGLYPDQSFYGSGKLRMTLRKIVDSSRGLGVIVRTENFSAEVPFWREYDYLILWANSRRPGIHPMP